MEATAQPDVGRFSASTEPHLLRVELQIGSEKVEVEVGTDGLHFRDPHAPSTRGVLFWEEAIALALLPHRLRLGRRGET